MSYLSPHSQCVITDEILSEIVLLFLVCSPGKGGGEGFYLVVVGCVVDDDYQFYLSCDMNTNIAITVTYPPEDASMKHVCQYRLGTSNKMNQTPTWCLHKLQTLALFRISVFKLHRDVLLK